METWEYLELVVDTSKKSLEDNLNKFGQHGWEALAVVREKADWWYTIVLKRPSTEAGRSALKQEGET